MKKNIYHHPVLKTVVYAGTFLALALLPLFVDDLFLLNQLSQYCVYALLAVSVSVVWGYGGILSLGQGIAFGLAAYGMAMTMQMQAQDPESDPIPSFMLTNELTSLPWLWEPFWSTPLGLILAIAVPTVFFIVFGWLMFQARVAGVFVAIMTLAMCAAWYNMAYDMQPFTAGFNGISPPNYLSILGFEIDPYTQESYWLCVAVLALLTLSVRFLLSTRFGTITQAIREDAERARFLGYNVAFYQVVLFTISGIIAACAGLLWVMITQYVSPTALELSFSISMVVWAAVGGRGSLLGAAFGAVLINGMQSYVGDEFRQGWLIFLGATFILVVLFLPKGLAGLVELVLGLFSRSGEAYGRDGRRERAGEIALDDAVREGIRTGALATTSPAYSAPVLPAHYIGIADGMEERFNAIRVLFNAMGREARSPDDPAVVPYMRMDTVTFNAVFRDILASGR